jgi:hypothetical protein
MPCSCDHICFSLPCTLCIVESIWLPAAPPSSESGVQVGSAPAFSAFEPATNPRTVHWSRALPWASGPAAPPRRLPRDGFAVFLRPPLFEACVHW